MTVLALLAALAVPAADPVAGRWEGTSLCQVRPSPCHDEHAVYHLSAAGGGHYRMLMNKVVGGVEEEMGVLDGVFDARAGTLTAASRDRMGRVGSWRFRLAGDTMSGRLTTADGQVYRLIEVRRTAGR
jgi:hypothetical protein